MGSCLKDEESLERCRNITNILYTGSSRLNQDGVKKLGTIKII